MSPLKKVLASLAVLIGAVCLILGVAYYQLLVRPLPSTRGEIALPGLKETVEVYRDPYGVPHIFARNEEDLFFAQGYVTAQDRLWQMDMNRRIATGRLSEIFGERTLEADKFLRILGIGKIAEELLDDLSADALSILESYSKGVNCFLSQNKRSLPVEFRILQYEPDPWEPSHSLAYLRLTGWALSFAWQTETALMKLTKTVGEQKAEEAFPSYPLEVPVTVPDLANLSPGLLDPGLPENWASSGGSNSWVVSGERSISGKPMLANDPHLRLAVPSPWYEVHLKGGGYNVIGVSFPGLPLVVTGHNSAIAWGLTNLMADDVDFYIERINPDDPDQYRFQGRWQEMEWRLEDIAVKGRGKETIEVRSTCHGPIVSQLIDGKGEVISMRWTGSEATSELDAFTRINKASNWKEFKEGLTHHGVPAQNFVYADTAGNIGYWAAGAIPVRSREQGFLPVPGWTGENEWRGFVPFEELPHLFNPEDGFIATANYRVTGDEYPHYISEFWDPPWRIVRIRELLARKSRFTMEDFREIQLDLLSTQAREHIPRILSASRGGVLSEKAEAALKLLSSWDFIVSPHSAPACVYETFYLKLMENTFSDEMGLSLYQDYISVPNLPIRVLDRLIQKGKSPWFDDVSTPQEEEFADLVCRSLEEAATLLSSELGEDPSEWRWGDLHKAKFDHPLGKPRPLRGLLNITPLPVGGSFSTVNLGGYPLEDPSSCLYAPTARHIVDFSNVDNSLSTVPPGQSGHPRSPQYRDQVGPWLRGEYHPSYLDESRIRASAVDMLILLPLERQ